MVLHSRKSVGNRPLRVVRVVGMIGTNGDLSLLLPALTRRFISVDPKELKPPLESTLTDIAPVSLLESPLLEKHGEGAILSEVLPNGSFARLRPNLSRLS